MIKWGVSMRKPQCFISYCEKDATTDKVNAIINYLRKLAEETDTSIDFLFDKSLCAGENQNIFMDKLMTVDSVIIICTPAYKKRAECDDDENKKTGVYKEVQIIKSRIQKIKEYQDKNKDYTNINFKIFPLVLSISQGVDSIEAVPSFIEHLSRKRITEIQFDLFKNGKYKLSNLSIKQYRDILLDCISTTTFISSAKSEYCDMEHHDKMQKLIYYKKSEQAPILSRQEFVNTAFYEKVRNQSAYILIGRKGSGKSTTARYLYKQNGDKYKGKMELNINNIGLDGIYNYIYHAPIDENAKLISLRNDLGEVFTYEKLIEFTWLAYIHLYAMYIVCCEYKNNRKSLTNSQVYNMKDVFNKISKILEKIDERGKWKNPLIISPTLYFFALSNTYSYLNFVIKNSRDENEFFVSDIQAQLTDYGLLKYIFNERILKSFNTVIENCSRNILFTLDGIDAAADTFRKNALSGPRHEKDTKALFEVKLMFSLLELIDRVKIDAQFALYKHLDLCFSIPKDKFIEILKQNRDKFKYGDKYCGLDWSGIELLIMLRKRMESIANYPLDFKDKQDKKPEEIFDALIEEYFKGIPRYVTIVTEAGREYKVHIFHYMLRNSFWRPRDILTSLDFIMRQYYTTGNKVTPLSEINIKTAIKIASENIVNSEFYQEFSSTWPDIDKNISLFRGKNVLLDLGEFIGIITSKKFVLQLNGFEKPILEVNEIIKFLYEIGFIGVFVSSEYMKKCNMITNQGFIFYEGTSPLKGIMNGEFRNCKIMINPVFIETLNLRVNTEELLGIANWETLRELETSIRLKMSTDCFGKIN